MVAPEALDCSIEMHDVSLRKIYSRIKNPTPSETTPALLAPREWINLHDVHKHNSENYQCSKNNGPSLDYIPVHADLLFLKNHSRMPYIQLPV